MIASWSHIHIVIVMLFLRTSIVIRWNNALVYAHRCPMIHDTCDTVLINVQ